MPVLFAGSLDSVVFLSGRQAGGSAQACTCAAGCLSACQAAVWQAKLSCQSTPLVLWKLPSRCFALDISGLCPLCTTDSWSLQAVPSKAGDVKAHRCCFPCCRTSQVLQASRPIAVRHCT